MSEHVTFKGQPGYIEPGSPEYSHVIGCSEIATILGYGYEAPIDLWRRKTKRAPATEHKSIFDRGHEMEPIMARMVQEQHGRTLKSEQAQYRDPDRPWLVYHADGMFPRWTPLNDGAMPQSGPGIWEAKAPGSRMADKMRNEGMTPNYICQGQMGMYVASRALGIDITWGTYGFLDYDAYELVCFDTSFKQAFVDAALEKVDAFYRCLVDDVPPEDLNIDTIIEVPQLEGGVHEFTDGEVVELSRELADLKLRVLDPAKAKEDQIKDRLKSLLDRYEKAEVPGVMKFSYSYGKPGETIDGAGLLVYLEHVIGLYNEFARPGGLNEIKFDRNQWVKPKAPTRSFRPTVVRQS